MNNRTSNPTIKEVGTPLNEQVVWTDLFINSGLFKFRGTSDPVWRDWQPNGSGATFRLLKFNQSDEIFFSCQMPHEYKEGSEIHAHVHWTPCDRGIAEAGHNVAWKLDYTVANINGTIFPSSTTLDMTDDFHDTNEYHEVAAAATTIPGSYSGEDLTISHMLVCRLYRDTGDTWVGTGANAPALLQSDFHYQKDMAGSREQWVK